MSDHAKLPVVGTKPDIRPSVDALTDFQRHGPRCAQPGATGSDCFLTPDQRMWLIVEYKDRVGQAENKFRAALVKAQLVNLIKKDEDVPGVASFVIEVIVGQAFAGAKTGLKLLRSNPKGILGSFSLLPNTDVNLAADAIKSVDENSLVAKGISSAKKAVGNEIEDELKDGSEERQATGSYLSQLETEAEGAWEAQREMLGGASDAQLVVLFHSWGTAAGHTAAAYEAALRDKVARYQASPASKIGKTAIDTRTKKPLNGDPGYPEMEALSLRVTQEITDGEVKWMYYSHQEDIMDATPEGAKLGGKRQADPSKFTPFREIEPEFLDIAIRNNVKEWGLPFDTKEIKRTPYKAPADYVPPYVPPQPQSVPQPKPAVADKYQPPVVVPDELWLKRST